MSLDAHRREANKERRTNAALVIGALAVIVISGVVVFLLFRSGGNEGNEAVASAADVGGAADVTLSPATTAQLESPATQATVSAQTSPSTGPTNPPAATAPALTTVAPAIPEPTTPVPASPPARPVGDAAADLSTYFALVAAHDFPTAYTYFQAPWAPNYDDYVDYWGTKVESFTHDATDCSIDGTQGRCDVTVFVQYSDQAGAAYAGRCVATRIRLDMAYGDAHYLFGEQTDLEVSDC